MKYLLSTALAALIAVSMCSEASAQPSTLPAHSSIGVSPDGIYTVTRVYSPSAYTDSTQNIQVNFTITPNTTAAIQLPYATEAIELGVKDPNQTSSTGPISYVQGTRTLVNPSACTRSGIDNRTLNCNAYINFPASLRNGQTHMVYIRYLATSVYTGNTSLNWNGYYTLATMLSCSPAPACYTMGQPTPTPPLTGWPANSETNPLMPDLIDGNGDFIFDLDFSGMMNMPPECADPNDPGYDQFFCNDICTLEPWTDICMGPSQIFFIDPPIATGYEYSVTGTNFMSVKAPSLSVVNDPDGYIVSYLNSGSTASQTLPPGQSFTFPPNVSNFTLTGISPTLALDPSDAAMFPTGISVTGIPQYALPEVRITQKPITTTPVPAVPVANAGLDDSATAPSNVKLNGNASTHPQGGSLTYNWTQIAGPTVALLNPQTATPNFWTLNVTAPTTVSFELQVEDANGNQSVVDQVDILINPSPKMPQCTAWNRDSLVASLSAYPQGSGYSVTQTIDGQVKSDLQDLANDLKGQHANFGRLEIKSYISDVGSAASPILHGSSVTSMTPQSVNFTSPATPNPTPFWTGGHFSADNWYRWDTKINLWRDNGYSLDGVHFGDDCVYQTVFFKIDGTDGALQAHTRNGFRTLIPNPVGQLNFGDVKKPLVRPNLRMIRGNRFKFRGIEKNSPPVRPEKAPIKKFQKKNTKGLFKKVEPRDD